MDSEMSIITQKTASWLELDHSTIAWTIVKIKIPKKPLQKPNYKQTPS